MYYQQHGYHFSVVSSQATQVTSKPNFQILAKYAGAAHGVRENVWEGKKSLPPGSLSETEFCIGNCWLVPVSSPLLLLE